MIRPAVFSLVLGVLVATSGWSQEFHRGVNLTGWFQASGAGEIPFSRFGPQTAKDLLRLGVDVVRLPVNFVAFAGPGPDFTLDPRALGLLDRALDLLTGAGLTVVLDNHSDPLDPRVASNLETFLKALWTQLATRYHDRPTSLLFELQNEPHQIALDAWASIQDRTLATLRRVDGAHTVVLTGADWGSAKALVALPGSSDPHLVYTFHFYDPLVFTHQGASWAQLQDLSGVPFPPRAGATPSVGASVPRYYAKALGEYLQSDPVATFSATLDQVAAFARNRHVPVWCGELGVFSAQADPSDRVAWYRTVRTLLEARGIPWTIWDYENPFGLFQPHSAEVFDQDLNLPLVEALGFHPVPQGPPGPRVQREGFVLYHDGWGPDTREAGYHRTGSVDAQDPDQPHSGQTSLRLEGLSQYDAVVWEFRPWKDLGSIAPRGELSVWVRASGGPFSVDLRFVDGVSGPGALPWRLSTRVDSSQVPSDHQWHWVRIPLGKMVETGASDTQWHPPQPGAFRWDSIARFEIVPERGPLTGVVLGFDDLEIRLP